MAEVVQSKTRTTCPDCGSFNHIDIAHCYHCGALIPETGARLFKEWVAATMATEAGYPTWYGVGGQVSLIDGDWYLFDHGSGWAASVLAKAKKWGVEVKG